MSVTSKPIRVRMPAGQAYEPALVDAAHKVAARSGLAAHHRNDFADLVELAATTLNSGSPAAVVLEIRLQGTALSATMRGLESDTPPARSLMTRLAKLAADRGCRLESDPAPPTVSVGFEVGDA